MKTPEEIKKGLGEAIEEASWVVEGGDAHDLVDAVEKAHASMADALAYIQQLEKQCGKDINVPRWISVEERLPENQDSVFIAYGNGRVAIAYYDEDDGIFWRSLGDGAYRGVSATHWMPLPEPPKEE